MIKLFDGFQRRAVNASLPLPIGKCQLRTPPRLAQAEIFALRADGCDDRTVPGYQTSAEISGSVINLLRVCRGVSYGICHALNLFGYCPWPKYVTAPQFFPEPKAGPAETSPRPTGPIDRTRRCDSWHTIGPEERQGEMTRAVGPGTAELGSARYSLLKIRTAIPPGNYLRLVAHRVCREGAGACAVFWRRGA